MSFLECLARGMLPFYNTVLMKVNRGRDTRPEGRHLSSRSMLDRVRAITRRRTYDPDRYALYRIGDQVALPAGTVTVPPSQSIYDPQTFGRYELATQRVIPHDDAGDIWSIGFDARLGDSQAFASKHAGAITSDRYQLAMPLLARGHGVCLDACTGSPRDDVREHVTNLGYDYVPIDLEPPDGIRREDVTNLTFDDNSIARILSLDTLEHVSDYQAALREFRRVLEPGGVLAVHVPVYFFDRAESAPLDPDRDPWGHVRYFSARELIGEITAAGLVLLRAQLHLDYGSVLCVAGNA